MSITPMDRVHLSRDDAWRFQYRLRPYLDNATFEELRNRFDDIARNIYTLTPEAKVGAKHPDKGGIMWAQKLMDLALECYRRNGDIVDLGVVHEFPVRSDMLPTIEANRSLAHHASRLKVFCKYGKEEWMTELIEMGNLRISPASYFQGGEHNIARQDNELLLQTYVTPYDYDLGLVGSLKRYLPDRCWAVINNRKPSDHYIYCVTVAFDFRSFFDFDADACVIIRDQDELVRRLLAAAHRKLPGWKVRFEDVRYIDPYFMLHHLTGAGDDIYIFKSFRFMYQAEHRLVAIPPLGLSGKLDHIQISLGSLKDIAELVRFSR
jgi:hypothetical protein